MVYDATQPTNNTKLRNLGVVIRPNWEAIQTADTTFQPHAVNLANRTPLVVPNDPATIATAFQLYCKQDGGGNPMLYGKDTAGNVTQISNRTPPLSAQNGYTWLAGGMIMQWGRNHATGGVITNIVFPIAFSAAPYSITTNFIRSSGSTTMRPLDITTAPPPAAGFFQVWNPNGGHDFLWIAIGPKV